MSTTEKGTAHKGSSANAARQEKILKEKVEEDFFKTIAKASDTFNAYHKVYFKDSGMSAEELVGSVFLENLNLREFYPEELGGKKGYDALTNKVYAWFNKQLTRYNRTKDKS